MGMPRASWPQSLDVALAAGMAVVAEVELRVYDQPIHAGSVPLGLDSVLVLLPVVALAWRRAAPFPAALAAPILITAVGLAGGTVCFFSSMLTLILLVYAAAAWAPEPLDRVALATPVLLLAPMPAYDDSFGADDWVFGLVVGVAAWVAGMAARRWRDQSRQLAAALAEAEAGRDAQAELAVAGERARIARELHDVVAHGMSVIVMQAGAARPAVHDDPEQVATALERIEETGRNAMLEMRRLLGILRDEADSGERQPQPRLKRVPTLLDELAAAGLAVTHRVDGEPRPLADAQDVSAYRIVQEALTNALRHGSGGSADVAMSWQDKALRIEVSNPVDERSDGVAGGHGLVGIRERVALFGGRFSTGRTDDRYLVVAELPYDEDLP